MIYQLLIDFGMVVLIWMTQLIVYPSFTKFEPEQLRAWHSTYSTRISILVIPLMIGQLGIHSYFLVVNGIHVYSGLAFGFILLAWVNTFFFAVPLHSKISAGEEIFLAARKLVKVNTWRTGFWSFVFLIDLILIINQ